MLLGSIFSLSVCAFPHVIPNAPEIAVKPTVFTSCASADAILTINSLELNPNPITKGVQSVITIKGFLSSPVDKGAVLKFQLKRGGLTIFTNNNADFCKLVKDFCPANGEVEFKQELDLPKLTPGVLYVLFRVIILGILNCSRKRRRKFTA
jgi:hypothetical protein